MPKSKLKRKQVRNMNIDLKFICRDLVGNLRDGIYEVPDAVTVKDLVDVSCNEADRELSESVKDHLIFLVNSKPAKWETTLTDGDKVRVLYKIVGG